MHLQLLLREKLSAKHGMQTQDKVWAIRRPNQALRNWLAPVVAITFASAAQFAVHGVAQAQEKSGVAISLTLNPPAAPETKQQAEGDGKNPSAGVTVTTQPATIQSAKELASKELASKELASKEPASKEPASKEPASKEPATKESASGASDSKQGTAESPFALSAFERPVKVLMTKGTSGSNSSKPSNLPTADGKHQIGQLILVDPSAPPARTPGSIDINMAAQPAGKAAESVPTKVSDKVSASELKVASQDASEAPPSPQRKVTTGAAKLETTAPSKAADAKSGPGSSAAKSNSEQTATPKTEPSNKVETKTTPAESKPMAEATGRTQTTAPNTPSGKTSRKRIEFDNEDAETDEASPTADGEEMVAEEDVALEQEPHPFDAPKADPNLSKPDRPEPNNVATFTPQQLRMRDDINRCLTYYLEHPETTARRSPWAVMHAILPFGVEAELGAGSRRVNAIGWACYNGLCKTQRMFQPTTNGFRINTGPGVQGHEGQFLAILAQSKVAPNYPIKMGNRNYTINDLVRYEMATCREKSELTFKLIGLSYYLDQKQVWRDNRGGTWSLEKLVAQELDQPVVGAACGGTHRLMGLTFSLLQRKQAGLPITGHWQRSEQYLNDFVAYAMSLQNPDGSFSTEWFEGRANESNVERKVQTTGHTLEWLVYTLPDEQLQSPPVTKAIQFLLNTVGAEPGRDWPIGPRGHALRALALYNQRVFGAQTGKMRQFIATSKTESQLR